MSVQGEARPRDPVGIAAEQGAEGAAVVSVGGDIVETEQNVVASTVAIRRFDADHPAAVVGDADPQAVVLQREKQGSPSVRQLTERLGGQGFGHRGSSSAAGRMFASCRVTPTGLGG